VSVLCKTPDAHGSLVARSPLRAGPTLRHVVVARSELLVRPGGAARGSVHFGRTVQTLGRATPAGWQRILTDTGQTGWVRTSVLGPP
jgi:hypothetical protein